MNNTLEILKDNLRVKIFPDRKTLGKKAAEDVAEKIISLSRDQKEVRIIFAAAPSQNEFLEELVKITDIEWESVIGFHMDEYIGLNRNSDQVFSKYLKEIIFNKVPFKEVHLIEPFDNPLNECKRYEALLKEKPIDIVCMGIGENGHIAFNDPPVADFKDPYWVKIVELDEACRQQQVNDGCFSSIYEVPERAITLTIPALMRGNHLSVVVPGERKAAAVKQTLNDIISTRCPATIIRKHKSATIYLDKDSAFKIEKN